MAVTIVRAFILYLVVTVLLRLMGKRQIGELEPAEFVITMLISEIAAIPMQDNRTPIINSVIALFILVSLEIIISVINLKSVNFRGLMQGHPVIVIRDGSVDIKALAKLRITLNDLLAALRQKDIFDVTRVSYAVFETNGRISVLLKPKYANSTAKDLKLSPADNGMPFAVVCDGKIIENALNESGRDQKFIEDNLNKQSISLDEVIIMTVDKSGKINVLKKD